MSHHALKFRDENPIVNDIPYSYHLSESVISTPQGEYLTVWKVEGRTYECASQEDAFIWHDEINNLIRSIGTPNVAFWTHEHHHPSDDYPVSQYKTKFCQELDKRYRGRFNNSPVFVTDLYLTVIYNPVADKTQKSLAKLEKKSLSDIAENQLEALAALEEINGQIETSLKEYGAKRLGIYFRDRDGNVVSQDDEDSEADISGQHAYSSALEWLAYLVNGERSLMPVGRDRIRDYLVDSRAMFGLFGEMGEIRTPTQRRYLASVEIRDYEAKTEPGQINNLKELEFEYILTQSFACMSPEAARGFLTRQQRSMLEVGDASTSQIEEMNAAKDAAVARRFVFGHHHATVHTYGSSPKAVRKQLDQVKSSLTKWGITPGVCGLSSEAAYLAMLPGNWRFRPRPVPINSWNFACFAPFHNHMTGKPTGNPWGPAVTLFKTRTGSPFYFNFHPSDLGRDETGKRPAAHTLILGMSGEGKTTLLDFLLAQSEKFGARYTVYDKDLSTKPLILAMGGKYRRIHDGVPSGWQPLQMDPTPRNLAFCKRLVIKLVKGAGEPVTHRDEQEISQAVEAVMGEGSLLERHERVLTSVLHHLPRPHSFDREGPASVADRLSPWCAEGQYGWLFDNPRDDMDLTETGIYGYDLTEFLTDGDAEDPHPARAPMLMYLMYRNSQLVDGEHPHIEVFEEFWKYLDDPDVSRDIKDGLLTRRKFNSFYVFSTQEPEAALSSSITSTIRQQLATLLLLPNPKADWASYQKLRLTRSEFDTVKGLPSRSRQFLVKTGDQSTVAKFDLGGSNDDLLSVLSGTPDSSRLLDQIIQDKGAHPDAWLDDYMREATR